MTLLALLEFRLEEPPVIEPLRIKHIAIHIIAKYPDLPALLSIILRFKLWPQRYYRDFTLPYVGLVVYLCYEFVVRPSSRSHAKEALEKIK